MSDDPRMDADEAFSKFIEQGELLGQMGTLATALGGFWTGLVEGGMPSDLAFALTTRVAMAALMGTNDDE